MSRRWGRLMVLKLQRSIVTTHDHPIIVAYNRDKSFLTEWGEEDVPCDYDTLFGGKNKLFIKVKLDRMGNLGLCGEPLPDQGW